jgi:hypothetical protein
VGDGVDDKIREFRPVHAVKWLLATLLTIEMRVLVLESPEETKKLDDAVSVALNLQGPSSGLFERFMVLVEDLLLDLACAAAEKAPARIV